ncbi:unnamed protein product [Amoebophrya sp. A25]|nr:unnamed protein product [Amoebophrya sp. A25]|eukprot:GSA25T00001420001.1
MFDDCVCKNTHFRFSLLSGVSASSAEDNSTNTTSNVTNSTTSAANATTTVCTTVVLPTNGTTAASSTNATTGNSTNTSATTNSTTTSGNTTATMVVCTTVTVTTTTSAVIAVAPTSNTTSTASTNLTYNPNLKTYEQVLGSYRCDPCPANRVTWLNISQIPPITKMRFIHPNNDVKSGEPSTPNYAYYSLEMSPSATYNFYQNMLAQHEKALAAAATTTTTTTSTILGANGTNSTALVSATTITATATSSAMDLIYNLLANVTSCKCLAVTNHYVDATTGACTVCPEHSSINSAVYHSSPLTAEAVGLGSCKCPDGYLSVYGGPNSDQLVRCRRPDDCDIIMFLAERTGSDVESLHWGTCGFNFTTNAKTSILEHESECVLRCLYPRDPEDPNDVWKTVPLRVYCDDGVLTGPSVEVKCSKGARSIPVAIFFSFLSLAAGIAALMVRQRNIDIVDIL